MTRRRRRPLLHAVTCAALTLSAAGCASKRVARIDPSGVHLRGDNPAASTDARAFGPVPAASVKWRAVLRYWPLDRIGPIPPAPG